MLVNCWNCGTGFDNASSKQKKCSSCGWAYCPSCGVCAPKCNFRLLNTLYNRWLRKNCNKCLHQSNCEYEVLVLNKKYMLERIDKGKLEEICAKRQSKIM